MDSTIVYEAVAGFLIITFVAAFVLSRSLERSLFATYVLSLPIRASIRLGPIPPDITALINTATASGNPAWIGYPLGTPNLYVSDIPLFLLIALSLYSSMSGHASHGVRFSLTVPILLVSAAFISMINAQNLSLSHSAVIELFKAILGCWYVVRRTKSKSDFDYCIALIGLAISIQAGFSIAQFITRSSLGITFSGIEWGEKVADSEYIRSSATFAHPQMLAMYLALFLPLLFSMLFAGHSGISRVKRFFVVGLGSLSMLLTFSRMGWLAITTTFLYVVMNCYLAMKRSSRLILQTLFLLMILFCLSLPVMDSILPNLTLERTGSDLGVISDLYGVAFGMIIAHPLFGIGLNNFSLSMPQFDKSGIYSFYPAPVHNLFVLVCAETGCIGLFALIAMFVLPGRALFKLKKCGDPYWSKVAIGLLAGQLGFFLLSLTGWTYYTIQTQVWFFWGIIYSACSVARQKITN
jgi:hypothetical protein